MTLPQKKSRQIQVDGDSYRWLVSFRNGVLNLTVQSDVPGQLLQAAFEPHDGYARTNDGWERQSQGRHIQPSTVRRVIQHAIANGWTPRESISTPFRIRSWSADEIVPCESTLPEDQIRLRDIAIEQVCDLQYDLSLDPKWRKLLFEAPVGEQFPIAPDYFGISAKSREHGLRYSAFNDGVADDWGAFVVFGIASVDFPNVVAYTTNNASIVDW